ncbi:kinase-like domain-containing protein [Rhizophagus clarus]|uniref:Kinase-like domain-containing protein n=1 Tax=Rhizophagus clarus TaxID=94130 RepID=A0A8H3KSW6_9GLOM|nr:kinase-like domain-containing protein [Rhizophagus clarus]
MDLGCSGLKLEDYYYDFDESDSELGDNSGLKLEDYYFDIGDLELGEYYYNTNDISDLELGDYYHNEKKDYKKAIAIYRKCAYEGNIHGINRIAEYYILRRGVDENDDENDDKAFEWYEYSAGKNDVIGALYMGYCYKYKIGVAVNNMEKNERKRKEIEWFQKAADLGSPEGAFQIGLHYESLAWSQNNAEENGKKAMKYFARSANLGFACGYFKLYKFYKDKNIDKANHFYNNYCLEVCKAKHLDDVIEVHSSALYIKVSKYIQFLGNYIIFFNIFDIMYFDESTAYIFVFRGWKKLYEHIRTSLFIRICLILQLILYCYFLLVLFISFIPFSFILIRLSIYIIYHDKRIAHIFSFRKWKKLFKCMRTLHLIPILFIILILLELFILFILDIPILLIDFINTLTSLFVFAACIYFTLILRWKKIFIQSVISISLSFLTYIVTIHNSSFDTLRLVSYLLYLSVIIQFIVSKELSYLLLPFLFSYGLLSYGRHSLGVTDLKILLNQHHIYLALLCITIFFSQLINFICCTLPVTIIIILKPIFSFDIFKELANYPGIFKHFIMIFLSRGLSIGELKMIEKYLNIYSSDKLYFWFDQNREKRTKEYSHVSFEKDSFEYLEKLRKDEIKEYKIKQKIKDNEKKIEQKEEWENEINWENEIRKKYKLKYFKEKWHIFIIMLIVDFY